MRTDRNVAVITGASRGIGAALGKAYRDRNYHVVATSLKFERHPEEPSSWNDCFCVGFPTPASRTHPGTRRRKSAKARSRGRWSADGATGAMAF